MSDQFRFSFDASTRQTNAMYAPVCTAHVLGSGSETISSAAFEYFGEPIGVDAGLHAFNLFSAHAIPI